MDTAVSRRQFVVGSAAAGLGIAAASSLAAAAPQSAVAAETVVAAGTSTEGARAINPQDYSYTTNSIEDFSKSALFSEWQMGGRTFHHRMVKSAAFQLAFLAANPDEYINYYLHMAKGGVEMIWIEDAANLWEMTASPFKQDYSAYDMKGLVDALHAEGCTVGYQFDTMGAPIGPLDYTAPFIGDSSKEEIQSWEQVVVDIAKTLQADGFDAIELNMAANNVGQSFLSRARNNRDDEYGAQSLENRTRWAVETIRAIKEACGPGFMVQALINGIEENDADLGNSAPMTTVEESRAIAKILEEAGADSLHVRIGPAYTHIAQLASELYFCANGLEGANAKSGRCDFVRDFQGLIRGDTSGCGMNLDMAAAIKDAASIPVGCATYNDPAQAPDLFESAIAEGKVDFLVMNRPLCVDPGYVNKLREGRIDEIAPCTRCLHCHIGGNQQNRDEGYCRVNALTQRVMTPNGPATYELPPAETVKKVMVVGAGPAGMEAARITALRGHDVTLYEKTGVMGGLLPFASAVKGPHENLDDLNAYLQRQCELAGVHVVLDTEVDADLVASEAPDALVLACGGSRVDLGFDDAGFAVVPIEEFMFTEMGPNVVVYGSNAQAFDTALWLTVHKKHVTMVTPSSVNELDKQQSQHAMRFMTSALYALGLQVYTGCEIVEAADGQLTVHSSEAGVDYTLPCDALVNAADMVPNTGLLDEVQVAETYAIGDCAEPFNIALAIRGGNDAGRAL